MGLLTKSTRVDPIAESGNKATVVTDISLDRLIVLAALALSFGVIAMVLYLTSHDGPAGAMLSVVTAILAGGLGIATGEKSGAADATKVLNG